MRAIRIISSIVLAILLVACSALNAPEEPQIEVSEPWIRATAGMVMDSGEHSGMAEGEQATAQPGGMAEMGGTSAAYMTIRNRGREADRLLGVKADFAEIAQIHNSETRNGLTMMFEIDGVDVPGRGRATLEPGGMHIMLMKLNRELAPGEVVSLTLQFEKSGDVPVEAEVRAP
jgi:copper(I)-binding protein